MIVSFGRRNWNGIDELRIGGNWFYNEKWIGFGREVLVTPWIGLDWIALVWKNKNS